MNNENMSSGKGLTLVKTTLLPGQERMTVVASLPTNQSCDVTANIPMGTQSGKHKLQIEQPLYSRIINKILQIRSPKRTPLLDRPDWLEMFESKLFTNVL